MDYSEFIARKKLRAQRYGFEPVAMNHNLRDWQARIVRWSVMRGRAAVFAGTGLGKSLMQLSWAENIVKADGPVLIVAPLGVRLQTAEEAQKFGIDCDVRVVLDQSQCGDGINITNYDRLDKFHGGSFSGVVLDESSILKSIEGKTRKLIGEMFANTQYRLACTATPSPNDHAELGNHAEFLGVMKTSDMLQRFFFHDSGDTSKWTLMPAAHEHFWEWVASWAVCIGMPSDLGGDDTGYVLPELRVHRHELESEDERIPNGFLFSVGGGVSATSVHEEKRLTVHQRVAKAIEIVNSEPGRKTLVWCDTNQEQDLIAESLGSKCVSIAGSTKSEKKEQFERAWRLGDVPVLLSKGSIFGSGMNWQHCSKMVFVGLTYSFETYYQSIRRCWRFGQPNPVDVHLVIADSETALQSAIARKENDFETMREGMAAAMRAKTLEEFGLDHGKQVYNPTVEMTLPNWLLEKVGR